LENHQIVFDKQFGFRSKHNTDHAILSIVDKIQNSIEGREYSCRVFLDFSKAFDTLNHKILFMILNGIRGIANEWFRSHLDTRQQIVTVNGVLSAMCSTSCGIPRGSVLGPLLFLLFINDFHNSSKLFEFHLFAEDANLFYEHKSLQQLQENINYELINIHTWHCASKLSLNIEKSNLILFHPPLKKLQDSFNLKLCNKQLKREYCVKYLGILIDSHLNWKKQVELIFVGKKNRTNIGILCKLRHVDLIILVKLCYALIYPFLTYGILIWGNTYEATLKPPFILQCASSHFLNWIVILVHHLKPLD